MKSTKRTELADITQVQIILERIDNELTPIEDLAVEYLKLGMIESELARNGLYDVEPEIANKIISERRVLELQQQAVNLLQAYQSRRRTGRDFVISYFASVAGATTASIIAGVIALSLLVGNTEGAKNVLAIISGTTPVGDMMPTVADHMTGTASKRVP